MENQFKQLEYIIREFNRLALSSTKKIVPALKIGPEFLPIESAGMELARKKVRFISFYLTSKGIRVKRSTGSESIYFNIQGHRFRVSDHRIKMTGDINHEFIVRYDSCVVQLLHEIKMAHFKLDQYFG